MTTKELLRLEHGDRAVPGSPAFTPSAGPSVSTELQRVVDGDAVARAWMYDTFSPGLFRRLRARYAGANGVDPEELLHDAFVSCLQHDARVVVRFLETVDAAEQTRGRFEIFLYGLACGIASNRRRSMRRKRSVLVAAIDEWLAVVDCEQQHIVGDVLTRLALCLRRASSRVYLYYKLRYVDGLTPDEISRTTGWSRKATYKLKSRLNEGLATCLERLGLR